MNNNFALLVLFTAIVIAIFKIVYDLKNPMTVRSYVETTYIYIILAILLVCVTILIIDKYNLISYSTLSGWKYLAIFILLIIIIIALSLIDKKKYVLRHILWLAFVVGIGIILYPYFEYSQYSGILWKSIITVIIIILGLTFVASRVPHDYFNSWGPYLSMGLIALIVFGILTWIFGRTNTLMQNVFAFLVVILFSGYVLYDTKRIYQAAEYSNVACKDVFNKLLCTDFPGQSLSLFIDIVNIFTAVSNLYS